MPAEQIAARGSCANAIAHFIGNAPASFADDGGLAAAYRQDGNKKNAQVMVDSLEIGLRPAAQRT